MEPQNSGSFERQIVYHIREMSLAAVPGGYIVSIEGESERFYTDLWEAWTYFSDTFDARARNRIKNISKGRQSNYEYDL